MRASHVECLELVVNRKTQGAQASNQAWAANDCVMQKYQSEIQRWAIKRGLSQPLASKTGLQHKKFDGLTFGLGLSQLCQYFRLEPDS
jgi:hypothetical protein